MERFYEMQTLVLTLLDQVDEKVFNLWNLICRNLFYLRHYNIFAIVLNDSSIMGMGINFESWSSPATWKI